MEASRGLARPRPAPARDLRGLLGPKRLARQAAAGDERAFTTIFERHHQELYRYCLAILRNPADAEDALQSTMSKALQALPGDGREIRLRPWLFRVAHNESIAILRERQPARAAADDLDPVGGVEPEAAAERSERLRTLVADLKQLPDRQRSALVMRELSGLGYGEIAAALDCGEGAARQTVYEARVALQTRAEGRQMECEEARKAISAGDRRRLRGRKLRAHLSGCDGCSDFEAAIARRRQDLAAIAPPLPFAAAAGVLAGLAGGGGSIGAGVAAVGSGVGGIAGGAALKGASVAAALVLAAGVADKTGVIDLPTPFGPEGSRGAATSPTPGSNSGSRDGSTDPTAGHGGGGGGGGEARGANEARSAKDGGSGSAAAGKGQVGDAPAHSSDGNGSATAPGQSGTAPGQTGTTPGQSGTTPGQSGTAPGQNGSNPGQSESALPPGQAGTAPGLSGSTPGHSDVAPGQSSKPVAPAEDGSSAATPPGQDSAPGQAKKG